jgi:hypothetical protein
LYSFYRSGNRKNNERSENFYKIPHRTPGGAGEEKYRNAKNALQAGPVSGIMGL